MMKEGTDLNYGGSVFPRFNQCVLNPDKVAAFKARCHMVLWVTPEGEYLWDKPTPPTPAGAGTETPETDAAYGGFDCLNPLILDHARKLEQQRDALRRQAEADRATLNTLNERIECDAQYNGTLMSENTSLRAQLASADKDRERMDWLEQDCSALVWNDTTPGVERATDGKEFFGDTLRAAIDAALQPTASLDHGARGANQDKQP